MRCAAPFLLVALALLDTPTLARDLPGGGLPGGLPGGNPGELPGGNPGELPGGNPGELPGGNPGELPGGEVIAADCFESKKDNFGGDLPGGEVSASSAEACQQKCQKKSGCLFFTYIKKASWGSNKCFLKGANVQLKGCDVCVTGPATCETVTLPPNTCAMVHCAPGQKCKDGECQEEENECMCAGQWDPVCGSDGKTYSNEGCATCGKAEVACSGQCPCSDPCAECPAGSGCQDGKCTGVINACTGVICPTGQTCQTSMGGKCTDDGPKNDFCPELKNLVGKYC